MRGVLTFGRGVFFTFYVRVLSSFHLDGVLVDLVQELDAADARLSFTDEHALNATRVQAEAKKLVDLSDANVDSPATAGKRVSERVVGFVRADEVASHACV